MAQTKLQSNSLGQSPFKASKKNWNDWKWQLRNQIKNVDDLKKFFELSEMQEQGVRLSNQKFRMAITPYYASLIDPSDPMCPIGLQAIPREAEIHPSIYDLDDPLAEDEDSPVPGLTHRYPDRVLLLVTQVCSMYCRHCTRRRMVGEQDIHFTKTELDMAIEYIKEHEEVRDIVVSGGDPLTMSDAQLDNMLKRLSSIKHVEIIRLGTRVPVVNPMRITAKLCKIIKKYQPVYVNTHFNHPKEITKESTAACLRLVDNGIPVNNQSVLLRHVNDCPHVMKELLQKLLQIRVRPYYIYQCDLSMGISHFRTSISKGIEIMESLRGHTSGMALPTFVVDAPGGGGKIPVMPNYIISQAPGQVVLRNFEGSMCRYIENTDTASGCGHHKACSNPRYTAKEGPALMMQKNGPMVIGQKPERKKRISKLKRRAKK